MDIKTLLFESINISNCVNMALIVFGVMYIIKASFNKYWSNKVVQRFIVVVPILIGIIISIINVLVNNKGININTISEGVLSGMLAISIYKFSKDIVGDDFVTVAGKMLKSKK